MTAALVAGGLLASGFRPGEPRASIPSSPCAGKASGVAAPANTGAVMNGRALAQTSVTLNATAITQPAITP
jgi:hypothetical protein